MGLLAPLALLALPLLIIIVALYLLKLRRPTAPVGSLHLWGALTRDREANSLWQRLRVSALLLLQLLILTLLILALARPWVPSVEATGQNAVIIIDLSASMGARDEPGGPTRLDIAKDRARSIINNLPQGATTMLLTSTDKATVEVPSTDDHGRLNSAIDNLSVQAAPGDMTQALKLAAAVAARDTNSTVWLISDGAFPPADTAVESLPGALTFVQVGDSDPLDEAGANQGITALSLEKEQAGLSLFMQVSNSQPVSVSRRIDLLADDVPWTARNVEIGPGTTQEVTIEDVPLGARIIQARFAGIDALDLDDQAWVVNRASVPANVLLITEDNKFLQLALSLLPTVNLYKVSPADYSPDASLNGVPFDLTIFDAGVPTTTLQTLPPGGLMLFAPSSNPLISVTGVLTAPEVTSTRPEDATSASDREPLLKFVDLSSAHISNAIQMEKPTWGRVLAASGTDPLIVAGEQDGRNIVIFAFDLRDSDLPLQTAFPLLIRNLTTYLLPLPAGGLPAEVAPGQPVGISLVSSQVTSVVIEDPTATETDIPITQATDRVAYGNTARQGVYYVTQYAGDEIVAQEAFAVNLFSRSESLSMPSASPALPPSGAAVGDSAEGEPPSASNGELFKRELWPTVALLGILALLIEWLYAQRIAIRRAIVEWQTQRSASRLERM